MHQWDQLSSKAPACQFPSSVFQGVSRWPEEVLPGWYRPAPGPFTPSESGNYVVKLQAFATGGYEMTCRRIVLPDLARAMDGRRRKGKREKPEKQAEEDVARSFRRAKRKMRQQIKNHGADRLFTLTRRETDAASFWSVDDWAAAWKRFVELCRKAGESVHYVAVLERHQKGNLHMHVALTGRININLARGIWWAICGGRGQGNVDVKYRKRSGSRYAASGRIARYMGKYLGKSFGDSAFNRKRYWHSRATLPDIQRFILSADNAGDAWAEVCEIWGINRSVAAKGDGFYPFPSGDGWWFAFDLPSSAPPPF